MGVANCAEPHDETLVLSIELPRHIDKSSFDESIKRIMKCRNILDDLLNGVNLGLFEEGEFCLNETEDVVWRIWHYGDGCEVWFKPIGRGRRCQNVVLNLRYLATSHHPTGSGIGAGARESNCGIGGRGCKR